MLEKLIVRFAIMIAAAAPIWRRLYIEHFWASTLGTVIRVDLGLNPKGGWVWVPTIEYHVAGQRWAFAKNYWQVVGAKSAYKVGDEVELLYHPRKPWRFTYKDNWVNWIFPALGTGMVGLYVIAHLPPDV
jgi:Protein of unknown function (DUF3592)